MNAVGAILLAVGAVVSSSVAGVVLYNAFASGGSRPPPTTTTPARNNNPIEILGDKDYSDEFIYRLRKARPSSSPPLLVVRPTTRSSAPERMPDPASRRVKRGCLRTTPRRIGRSIRSDFLNKLRSSSIKVKRHENAEGPSNQEPAPGGKPKLIQAKVAMMRRHPTTRSSAPERMPDPASRRVERGCLRTTGRRIGRSIRSDFLNKLKSSSIKVKRHEGPSNQEPAAGGKPKLIQAKVAMMRRHPSGTVTPPRPG